MAADLFDDAVVAAYIDQAPFMERPWLARLIEEQLSDPQCRIVLVTGAPGTGKTAFMAWLARRYSQSLRYFLRRDSVVPHRHGDVYALLESLGHQLAVRHPEAFIPARLAVTVRQEVGDLRPGGRLVGIRIEELAASPFYETALQVTQKIAVSQGDATGIEIGRMVTDVRTRGWEVLERMALTGPAEVLAADKPAERIMTLIDALDEADGTGGESILDWLITCPDLPSTLRIVVTSRPGSFLTPLRNAKGPWLREISLEDHRDQSLTDVQRYLNAEISRQEIATTLTSSDTTPETFIASIASRAAGNFQYAVAVLRTVVAWRESSDTGMVLPLIENGSVPTSLTELYAVFMAELSRRTHRRSVRLQDGERYGDLWADVVRPILAALTVARAPLTRHQISQYADIVVDHNYLDDGFIELTPFLLEEIDGYRLYHASLADALGENVGGNTDPAAIVDLVSWNLKLSGQNILAAADQPFLPDDDYRWQHAAAHLTAAYAAATEEQRPGIARRINHLIGSFGYLHGKTVHGGVDALLADLRTAIRSSLPGSVISLGEVEGLIDQLAHELRRWNPEANPTGFAQQLQHGAVQHKLWELADAARKSLDQSGLAYFEALSVNGPPSPGLIRTLAGHDGSITALAAVSADQALSAGSDGRVICWDIATGVPEWILKAHASRITALTVLDSILLTVSAAEPPSLWELSSGEPAGVLDTGDMEITAISAVDQGLVFTGTRDGLILQWSLRDRNLVRTFNAEVTRPINSLAVAGRKLYATFTPGSPGATDDGPRPVAPDNFIYVWDIETGFFVEKRQMRSQGRRVGKIAEATTISLHTGSNLIAAVNQGTQTLLNTNGQDRPGHPNADVIGSEAGLSDGNGTSAIMGRYLISGAKEGYVEIETFCSEVGESTGLEIKLLEAGQRMGWRLAGHRDEVTAIVALPGFERFLSGSRDGLILVWNFLEATTGRGMYAYEFHRDHDDRPRLLAANGSYMVVSGKGKLELLSTREHSVDHRKSIDLRDSFLRRLGSASTACITPHGWVATCSPGGYVYGTRSAGGKPVNLHTSDPYTLAIWDADARIRHVVGSPHQAATLLLTPNGRLVVGLKNGNISVWKAGTSLHPFSYSGTAPDMVHEAHSRSGHSAPITCLQPISGNRVLSGAADGSLRLWEPGNWRSTSVSPSPHRSAITSIGAMSAGGIVTTDRGGTLAIWSEDMTLKQSRQLPESVLFAVGSTLIAIQAGAIEMLTIPGFTPKATLRLPLAAASAMVAGSGTLIVDDIGGGRHCLLLADPESLGTGSDAPVWEPGPVKSDSLYAWPPLRRRIAEPLMWIWLGFTIFLIVEIHEIWAYIFFGLIGAGPPALVLLLSALDRSP